MNRRTRQILLGVIRERREDLGYKAPQLVASALRASTDLIEHYEDTGQAAECNRMLHCWVEVMELEAIPEIACVPWAPGVN